MTTKRRFYKTTYIIEVLSEDQILLNLSLAELDHEMNEGSYVGRVKDVNSTTVNSKTMAELLSEFGSEPGFFMLDDKGNQTYD